MHEMTVNNDFKSPNVSILYLGIMLSKRPSPVVRAKTWCETGWWASLVPTDCIKSHKLEKSQHKVRILAAGPSTEHTGITTL